MSANVELPKPVVNESDIRRFDPSEPVRDDVVYVLAGTQLREFADAQTVQLRARLDALRVAARGLRKAAESYRIISKKQAGWTVTVAEQQITNYDKAVRS